MKDINIHTWQRKYLRENKETNIDKIVQHLVDTNDGPVEAYGAMHRALEVAYYQQASVDDIGEALVQALEIIEENGGRLSSTEFSRSY